MQAITVKVGLASCGIAAGADNVYRRLESYLLESSKMVQLKRTGCIGMCFEEPIVEFDGGDLGRVTLGKVDPKDITRLLDEYLSGNLSDTHLILADRHEAKHNDLMGAQTRIVLKNCGVIDPQSIDEYEQSGGYQALKQVLEMRPYTVIDIVRGSGLRGRGGAGFPTGLKWGFVFDQPGPKKYVICNADEGDPGAFMDRSVLEGDPHRIIEGMLIGAYAMGADEGYIYCRAEYPLAIKHLRIAIQAATERNYLGSNILGTDFSFTLHIKEGAGAFVCGEETALMHSIEGMRGMPTLRPPYPAESGLWGKPTNINNVETWANIPWIILNGPQAFRAIGTQQSPGTKVFALAGKVAGSGLIEVPMGITIRDIIYKVGGGIKDGKNFKAIQLGGPSGGCIPAELLDTTVDYDSINATGAIMGSGGMVVMDEDTCMVDVAKYFLHFTQSESCGKCTYCRIGTRRMLEILERISSGKGEIEDIDRLQKLAENINHGSLCGLGQSAPNPVLTTLRYFRHEYEAHIVDKKCPTQVCVDLLTFSIDETKCKGCHVCALRCPVKCISGKRKQPHVIDPAVCIKCGSCFNSCRFDAVVKA